MQLRAIHKDDGYEIRQGNDLVRFIDENGVLSGISPQTGYSKEICPTGNNGEAKRILKKWLKDNS